MLKRISGVLFGGTIGETVQLFVVSRANNGVEQATFEYEHVDLDPQTIQGHPGCELRVGTDTRRFEAFVIFDPAATNGRYDLFQVNSAGGATGMDENVSSAELTPLIGFGIRGVAATAVVAPPGSSVAPSGARGGLRPPAATRKKAARKRTAKAGKKKSGKKPVTRKSVKKTATRKRARKPR